MVNSAKYFKQEVEGNVWADVDLVIRLPGGPQDAAPVPKHSTGAYSSGAAAAPVVAPDPLHLASFPAHNIVLDTSEYFKAQQGESWQQLPQGSRTASSSSSSTSPAQGSRPTVYLTIDSADQLPAAEAVIQFMYDVSDACSNLEQQQLVYAVVIADILNLQAAGQQALEALKAAPRSKQGLSAATLQVLEELVVWPNCLLQLLPVALSRAPCCKVDTADLAAIMAADPGSKVQRLLVAAMGDLQAAWADADSRAMLLQLPLPAMQLLLSSDQLRVPSEDTVLFIARRYVQAQVQAAANTAAKAALAPLVRAPHLSPFAWSLVALPAGEWRQLLSAYEVQLRKLQHLQRIASSEEVAAEVRRWGNAPASWLRPSRLLRPLEDGVRLEWRLPVEQLQQACRDSFTQPKPVHVYSPGSSPLGGVAWQLRVDAKQEAGGTIIGLYAGPDALDMPAASYCKYRYTATWHGVQSEISSPCMVNGEMAGTANYFKLQPMAGDGWDEAVWAAAGLPAAGDMLLQLHVHSVE